MNTAQQIYQEVQSLPETQAKEVLDFVGFLKWHQRQGHLTSQQTAIEKLRTLRGHYTVTPFTREELYDRASLR
jgi:hypothetical protein